MKLSRKVLQKRPTGSPIGRGFLDGQMLIASPGMRDERFARTLIYMCAHSSEGAMGIVIKQPARAGGVTVLKGGPVETERGFVLHSADFFIENSTLPIDEGICLTATLDILKAIAPGTGPASAVLALGY